MRRKKTRTQNANIVIYGGTAPWVKKAILEIAKKQNRTLSNMALEILKRYLKEGAE